MSKQVISYKEDPVTGEPLVELWGTFNMADLAQVLSELQERSEKTPPTDDPGPTGTCSLGFDLRS